MLGYTILNDKRKPNLGSSELMPLKVKEGVSSEFVRYLLLPISWKNHAF
jgi:hypothetical protein